MICVLNLQQKKKYELQYCTFSKDNNHESFFSINRVADNESYNKFIKLSGNYRNEDIIDTLDTSIEYPCLLVMPFNIPGYCVTIINKKLSIRPCRNDPYQRFVETKSSLCECEN